MLGDLPLDGSKRPISPPSERRRQRMPRRQHKRLPIVLVLTDDCALREKRRFAHRTRRGSPAEQQFGVRSVLLPADGCQ